MSIRFIDILRITLGCISVLLQTHQMLSLLSKLLSGWRRDLQCCHFQTINCHISFIFNQYDMFALFTIQLGTVANLARGIRKNQATLKSLKIVLILKLLRKYIRFSAFLSWFVLLDCSPNVNKNGTFLGFDIHDLGLKILIQDIKDFRRSKFERRHWRLCTFPLLWAAQGAAAASALLRWLKCVMMKLHWNIFGSSGTSRPSTESDDFVIFFEISSLAGSTVGDLLWKVYFRFLLSSFSSSWWRSGKY